MKNAAIHSILHESEIRDFLAKNVSKGYGTSVKLIEEKIKALQEELEVAKREEAALELIKAKGWEVFDVSDEISDYLYQDYSPFVGTKEEYESIFGTAKNVN